MHCCDLLKIQRGATALIGGGGKTTLLYTLGRELAARGTVLLLTTTHIFPPSHIPVLLGAEEQAIAAVLRTHRQLCIGTMDRHAKLSAPSLPVSRLCALADYVLIEADGSRGLPLKAHDVHEPVIPPACGQTILVLGASGLGRPIAEAAHRPALYAARAGCSEQDIATPEIAARLLKAEGLHDRVFINQIETEVDRIQAQALARLLHCPTVGGALQKEEWECLF